MHIKQVGETWAILSWHLEDDTLADEPLCLPKYQGNFAVATILSSNPSYISFLVFFLNVRPIAC